MPRSERFGTVVDAVEAGADPSGERSLNPVLDEVAGDDTMVVLPEGRYLMDDYWRFESFSNFGIVGDGATVVPPDGFDGGQFGLGARTGARDLLFEGITFDFRAPETGGRGLHVKVEDGLEVRDVSVRGPLDVEGGFMRVDVTDPSGHGVVERLHAPDGGTLESGTAGCYVGDTNRGDVDFVDCHVEGFPDNGIYAEPPEGRMRVIGGYYANNAISNVRINEGVIRGVHVRCDDPPEGFENMRGIRLTDGEDVLVEDCTVELLDVTFSDGAVVVSAEAGATTIRNTEVRVDVDDVAAILAKDPSEREDRSGTALRCECVFVEGSAAGSSAVRVQRRDGTVLDRVHVHQTGADRDGITLFELEDGVVRDSAVAVTGEPLVSVDSGFSRENVRVEGGRTWGPFDRLACDDAVTTPELRRAVRLWTRDEISTQSLRDLISLWSRS